MVGRVTPHLVEATLKQIFEVVQSEIQAGGIQCWGDQGGSLMNDYRVGELLSADTIAV